MKKILASILAITMLMTTLSTCVIPASAETDVATIAFTEDFENYGSGNWLANISEDGVLVDSTKIKGMKENTWSVYAGQKATAWTPAQVVEKGASMEVVADPADSTNKVLKMDAGDLGAEEFFSFRRNANGTTGVDHKDLQGKKMVIKAKFKLPAGYASTSDTAMLYYDRYNARPSRLYTSEQHGANYGSTTWTILALDSKNWGSNLNANKKATVPTEKWFDIKFVFNLSGDLTAENPADTYRGFFNDSIYTLNLPVLTSSMTGTQIREMNSKFPQPSNEIGKAGDKMVDSTGGYTLAPTNSVFQTFGKFWGTSMAISGAAGKTTDYWYMDDLMVYFIDDFKQEGEAIIEKTKDGNWYADEIKIPFTNDLMTVVKENGTTLDYKSLFTLKDAEGNVVEGGIKDAYADGKYLVITPAKTIERNASYTISASPLFMDAEGQGLNQYSKDQDIYTFEAAEDPFAHIIYDFDFDNYEIDGKDWIENRNNTTDRYVVSSGVEEGAITINKHSSASANHNITVVADPADPTNGNKVLALKAGYEGSGYVTQIRFNANGKTGLSRANDMGKGKNLVYKTRIFLPSGFSLTESSQLVNTASEGQNQANNTSGIGATAISTSFYAATTGSWGSPMARHQVGTAAGKWIEWKHVADVSEPLSATHSDTVRAYVDDIMYTSTFVKTNAASEGQVFGTNDKYSDIKIGDTVIDYLAAGRDLFTVNPYASIGSTWWGSAFNINPQTDTAKGDTFYLDDVEAFWIDDLAFNAVNAENFEGGKVKLNFNQKLREEVQYMTGNSSYNMSGLKKLAIADLFKVVDPETKEEIAGGIAAVTLSEDGKTVSITPSAELEKGGDYQIEISPYLVDEYGQGLLNNSKATYVDLHISETFTPFEMTSISQISVSGYVQGRDVKVTAKFSVAVDDEAITNGIVVKNEAGEVIARNNGWTANFGTDEDGNVDYKTVVFDFGSLPTDNYTVAINENFVATNGADLATAFGITIAKATDRIVLFEEDFDTGYTVDENWVNAANEVTDGTLYNGNPDTWSKVYLKSYTVNNHDWDVQVHFKTAAANTAPESTDVTDFIGVVAAPEKATAKFSGNALKIYNNRGSDYAGDYISFRRNFDKLNGINFESEEYKGKKLVYEADLYADSVASDNSFFVPFGATNTKAVRDYTDWKMLFSSGALRTAGHYDSAFASSGAMSMYSQIVPNGKITSAPTNYKIVVSMGENIDTTAMYVNGQLVERPLSEQARLAGHEWNNSARHEFQPSDGTYGETLEVNDVLYGIWGLVGQGGKTARTVYMDNFKAYLVDEFNVESVEGAGNVFNTVKGAVTYTFSKPVSADVVANTDVVLLNEAGEKVEGGIKSIELSDAGYKMTVKLSDTLPGLTKYSIKLNETLKDVDGLALSTVWKYYKYPIAEYYEAVGDNVYSVTTVDGATTKDMYYIPATASKPAYLAVDATGKNKAAIDTYVRDADAMKMFTVLTTSKATSLFADAVKATVSGNTVTTAVKFTNPEVTAMNVWCVVAAYGEYNEMLGCAPVNVTEVEASSSTEEIPVTFETNGGAVKAIKMFVWNNYEDMKPYQKAEDILNK